MAEVTPRLYIYGIIMFMLVITGGVVVMSQFAVKYPSFINNDDFKDFNSSFNRIYELQNSTDNLRASIEDANSDWGIFGVLNGLIKTVWSAFKNIFTSFDFMLVALKGLESVFGVPAWVVGLITSLVVTMLAFSIYSLVFQGRT